MAEEATEAAAKPKEPLLGLMLLLSCVVIWGVNAVAFKVATKPPVGVGLDPGLFTGLRFAVVTPCLMAMIALRGRAEALRLPPGDWKRYIGLGFVAIVLGETLQPAALRFTSVANLTLLSHGMLSLFTALWAWALYKQRIARMGWAGALIALAGVGLVAGSAPVAVGHRPGLHFGGETWRGDAIALFRSSEHSLYLLYLGQWLRKRSVLQVTVYNCAFGALWLLPYVIYRSLNFSWAQVPPMVWIAFAWSVVPTTLYGFLAWNWGLRQAGAVAATNLMYLLPVMGALAAWAILREPVTRGQILGGLVIIIGVVLLRWQALVEAGLIRLPEGRLRLPWRP